tara:strand:+ start:745 stop:1530 length:786 start_codon:yes stop_codon:yes gene_type:complete
MPTRTTREKKMMGVFFVMLMLFGYLHLRITGGVGADLINKLFAGNVTAESAALDSVIYPYQVQRRALEEQIELLNEDIQQDRQFISDSGGVLALTETFKTRKGELTDAKSDLSLQKNLTTQLLSDLIPKSDTMEELTAMRSQIAQLAAALKLDILETTPVRNIEEIGIKPSISLTDQTGNPIRYIDGAPVITYEQAQQIHQLPEIQLYQYKLSGNAVSFFVFLESINDLPWSLYVVSMDVSIPESTSPNALIPEMQVVLAF